MRAQIVLLVIGAVLAALSAPLPATAKTFIEISPQSGLTGTTVRVEGFGFADGEIEIALVADGVLSRRPEDAGGVFVQGLPKVGILPLTTAAAKDGNSVVEVTIPPERELTRAQIGKEFEVAAISAPPGQEIFIARARFVLGEVNPAALPSAGIGAAPRATLPLGLLLASLSAAGLALLAVGSRMRRGA